MLILCNPVAAGGRARRLATPLGAALSRREVPHELVYTEHAGHAAELAEREGRARRAIVALGGDGTVHEVVSGLAAAAGAGGERPLAALGIVPGGTGNDLARAFGLPRGVEALAAVLAGEATRPLDVVRVSRGGDPAPACFGNDLSVGYAARTVASMEDRGSLSRFFLRGHVAYAAAGVRALGAAPLECVVEVDDRRVEGRYFEVHLNNGAYCGGGISFAPHANPSDGVLDVALIERRSFASVVSIMLAVQGARLEARPGVSFERGQRVRISSAGPLPVYIDGDMLPCPPDPATGRASLEAVLEPGLLRVLVAAKAAQESLELARERPGASGGERFRREDAYEGRL